MRVLYIEPFSGASGDMFLGNLVDLGADKDFIRNEISKCVDVSVSFKRCFKKGILATKADVKIPGIENTEEQFLHKNFKTYSEIIKIIKSSDLNSEVKSDTLSIFEIMARAESKVHGISIDKIHFHEVGQDDAIADVVGSCAGFYSLRNRKDTAFASIHCAIVNVGSGFAKSAHGILPVPAPATLEILKESKLFFKSEGEGELLTPTGAAILSHFVNKYNSENLYKISPRKILKIGYGAGNFENEIPNVLRSSIVELDLKQDKINSFSNPSTSSISIENDSFFSIEKDSIDILETNVDDVTGEVLGNLSEKLFKEGAKDVSYHPVFMKKGRPGYMIRVISDRKDTLKLSSLIIRETGSLGIRVVSTPYRIKAKREIVIEEIEISGNNYKIPVKIAYDNFNNIVNISAEYEDCSLISEKTQIPVKEIIQLAEQKVKQKKY